MGLQSWQVCRCLAWRKELCGIVRDPYVRPGKKAFSTFAWVFAIQSTPIFYLCDVMNKCGKVPGGSGPLIKLPIFKKK